jgi:YD repeat-containing protein
MTAIKTITTYKLDYMQAKPGSDFSDVAPVISSFNEFDAEGNSLTEITYLANGAVEQRCEYKYNDKGLVVEEILINDEGEVDEKKAYEYNEKGLIIKEFLIYQDESFDTTEYHYDESGKLIEKVTVDPDGEPESRKEISYSNDLVTREVYFDAEGNLLNEIKYTYDEKGNETEVVRFTAEDQKNIRTEYVYNEEGKKTESYTFNTANTANELVAKNLYKEDEKGQLVEIIEQDQFHKYTTVLAYDDNGNMIEQTETNEAGELTNRIQRKFDTNNNLEEVAVTIDRHGAGLNQNYVIQYKYELF